MAEGPKARLTRIHRERSASRSKIALWLSSIDAKHVARWEEYVEAYFSLPGVSVPDLVEAISSDGILGSSFPEISSESLKKWMHKTRGHKKDSEG
tara:strand:+ start:1896 stop:2180 length:285 start_codon:yes stop_codon:yes gene_type:complete